MLGVAVATPSATAPPEPRGGHPVRAVPFIGAATLLAALFAAPAQAAAVAAPDIPLANVKAHLTQLQ